MSALAWVGCTASALVFAAFMMKGIVMVRLVALCSNVAFLVYGIGLHLIPVAALHLALIPVNCWRLWQALSASQPGELSNVSARMRRPSVRSLLPSIRVVDAGNARQRATIAIDERTQYRASLNDDCRLHVTDSVGGVGGPAVRR